MKVYVYAIAKDEQDNVQQFMEHLKDADQVYVLDTGSNDNTVTSLRDYGAAVVSAEYGTDFRFDKARNQALRIVPDDGVCLYLDLDERLDLDWRAKLDKYLAETIHEYKFYWYQGPEYGPASTFTNIRAHSKHSHVWQYPVHEVLIPKHRVNSVHTDIYVSHHPVPKERNYLPLLELAYRESPSDPRVLHYLGREYMFCQQYDKALSAFNKYCLNKHILWAPETSQVYIYCANCYLELGEIWLAEQHYLKAIAEFPVMREPYLDLAKLYLDCHEYESALGMVITALRINEIPKDYMYYRYSAWRQEPLDLAARCYLGLNLFDKAKHYFDQLFAQYTPDPQQIIEYVKIFGTVPAIPNLTISQG